MTWALREAELVYRTSPVRDLPSVALDSAADVVRLLHGAEALRSFVRGFEERFVAIGLDADNRPLSWSLVGKGSTIECPVDVAGCFRALIVQGACAAVVAHNHPSGRVSPSASDVAITKRLRAAGDLLGVPVYDHVIVGEDPRAFYSFRAAERWT